MAQENQDFYMKNKRTSIKDIAKALNVSITTISFVLNGKGEERKISKEVIKKIEDYAEQVNYRPNQVAQSLRTGKSKILVFMAEDIGNIFFAKIGRIIENIAYKKGYKVLFASTDNDDVRSRELIDVFHERQVDGFIIVPSPGIKTDIERLIASDIPVVLCDRHFKDLDSNYVMLNNYGASKRATDHLIENGYKNIAFITIDTEQNQMIERAQGYIDTVQAARLPVNVVSIPFSETNTEKGKIILREAFSSKSSNIDAVLFSTNYLTQNSLELFNEISPSLMHELGIITFDDDPFFKINTPSISSVAQPLQEIGEECMRIIFKLLKDKDRRNTTKTKVVLDALLIARDSSQRKKNF
ncbi:LacI family DNA-binding transcriptional regulator [Leeuwenhoekiella sp. H156]|uniref:LacI family DNA-binding transcriptional regulator n=1 Tax=Leeuwenhoekiella sp. H156 TaxID=3450128 RepID=UPI003FA422CF